jgi:CheY-like chemotaxis protein
VILLVEDDPHVREVAAFMIEDFGYRVVEAEDGAAALRALGSVEVDAIVTDITMPGISGYELAQRVRQTFPAIPIICVTGYSAVEHQAMLCDHFLRKPFLPADLQKAIKTVLPNSDQQARQGG